MGEVKRLAERNQAIQEMMTDGEKLKNFYRFVAQNPHISLYDACQIVIERPDASVCYSFEEWNALERRVTKGRKGIPVYDRTNNKSFVFDVNDTHGERRYLRQSNSMKKILEGLDALNGTDLAKSGRGDYRIILSGVKTYLSNNQDYLEDREFYEQGVAYMIYSTTGFPKDYGIKLKGYNKSLKDNGELFKGVRAVSISLQEEIFDAYLQRANEVKLVDDTEEDTVTDEPVIKEEKKTIVEINSTAASNYKGYVAFVKHYLDETGTEQNEVYLGKKENYASHGNYDNSDNSLLLVSRNEKIYHLLSPSKWMPSQAEMVENGSFSDKDYEELFNLQNGLLKQLEQENEIKFGLNYSEEGKPFSYPYYQDNKKTENKPMTMYEEYMSVQNKNPDCYVLKRVGDFYEIMGDKAKEVAENIDLTLTGRDVGLPERVPMVGFPYHVTDKYIDKLLHFASVVVMENGIEPKKILSYAELNKPRPELEELSEEESKELDKYFGDESEEEPEEDYSAELEEYRNGQNEDEEENEYEEKEELDDDEEDAPDFDYEEKTSEKAEKVKSEKPINDRKRKNKEFSLFDFIEKKEETPEEKAKNFILKNGSAFAQGKCRIANYYLSRPTEKEFADFLRKEYGIGGGSCTEFEYESNGKGLGYRVGERDNPDRIEGVLNWNQVALGIADLIDDDKYFDEEEKEEFKDYYARRHGDDKDRIKAVVKEMVKSGTNYTFDGTYTFDYPHFYDLHDFAKEHIKEIAEEITLREEVDSVSLDDNGIEVNFYPKYCRHLQTVEEPLEKESSNTDLNEVGLDQNELGGAKQRYKNNVEAIRLVNTLFRENRDASPEERKVLARYVGWGGIAQAFDEHNESWQKEYQELKNLLSAEEYTTAKGSVLNAHFTSKEVIEGMYKALAEMGVKGNNKILEPAMGTGNFFGFMPKEIQENARLYGVELDSITGRIATKLYPQAKIQIKGFEETSFKNDSFDLMVTNVPFGGYMVFDSDYNKYNFYIHDYFIAKGIDKIKPNGLMAVITSKGTMDKISPTVRKYIADRAELLGAIRLPNTAFKKTANTEVVTDILFFRKREEKINATVNDTEWLSLGTTKEGYEINNYFVNHPEMVLGSLSKETGLYGAEDVTVNPDGRELSKAIEDAIKFLPKNIYENPEFIEEEQQANVIEADYNVRPLNYKIENGKLYRRVGDEMVKEEIPSSPKDALDRIAGMIELRDSLRYVLNIQSEGCDDETLKREQNSLNYKYDRFVKKYGYLNSQTNVKLFKEDGDSSLLFASEELSEDKKTATKADVFSKRTIRPYTQVTQTDDCYEALQISKNERGGVDISYIEELTKKDYDTVLNELGNAVFRNPIRVNPEDKYSGFETAEEYLSGKVVEKLKTAEMLKEENPTLIDFDKNIKALEEVQPERIKATDIAVRIGTSWIDKMYYKQFLCELLHIPYYMQDGLELYYNPHDSSWRVDKTTGYLRNYRTMEMTSVYGTSRANAFRLFEDSLNQKFVQIFDTVEDENGHEKRVLNQAETIAAREKQNKIKEEFKEWIFAEPNRRDDLEEQYNFLFNQIRLPSYDGSYLKFPNMNPDIELRPHQKNAVARISTGQNTLLHHVVGSGKTFTIVASIQTLRRLGLCKKAMIVVPNHLVEQWSSDYLRLYPSAHILTTTKEDVDKQHRERFVSKVAMGDWDAIVISQSAFSKINISPERQIAKIQEQIRAIEESIEQQYMESNSRGSVKNLERIKKSRETMLKKLLDDEKKDNLLCFEKLGVDYLFVDEADAYKNLFMYTKMNNVAGISNAASQRASDLQLKIEYINELHGGDKGVVFATGTPISNSMTEMYTMQTYLSKETLNRLGVTFFDNWAADFGEAVTSLELAPSGQGYRAKTRFAKFTNLPELLTLYRSFADVQTSDMVKLDVPEAERKVITIKPSDTVVELTEEIAKRADRIYGGGVDPHEDNMLKVTGDGKKLALDPRTLDKLATDEPVSKLSVCAEKVYEEWKNSETIRGTQLVFCDLSTPKTAFEDYEYGKDFDAYNDLKYKLVKLGIPKEQIAFIHEANTDQQKQALFNNVNAGVVRVLIGSTEKCGAGTNVQKRLVAIHHLDAPYRPRDLIQRDGRGIRQGNMNSKISIYTYATERTFDSYSYQILENKQRFISQIDRGDLTVREAEDIDETTLSYAEIKAITSANPKIKRKMELDTEMQRLRVLESQYKKNLFALQDKIRKDYPEQIRKQTLYLERVKEDTETVKANFNAENFVINVLGKTYTDKKEGGQALMDALFNNKPDTVVAEYAGFKISLNPLVMLTAERSITIAGAGQYTLDIGQSWSGNLTRLENFFNEFPTRVDRATARLEQTKHDLVVAEEQVKVPFEHTEKILEINKELAEINAELDLNKRDEIVIDDGEESEGKSDIVVDNGDENYMALPSDNTQKRRKKMTADGYRQIRQIKQGKNEDLVFGVTKDNIYTAINEDAEYVGNLLGIEPEIEEINGKEVKVIKLESKTFDEAVNSLIDTGKTVAVFDLITTKTNDEDNFIDETDKVATMTVPIMPDFSKDMDDMHKYGYTWDGMLPLSKATARTLMENGLEIYKLNKEDSEGQINSLELFEEHDGLFGIEKPVWNSFIESKEGEKYLFARFQMDMACLKVIDDELPYVDEKFTYVPHEQAYAEKEAIEDYFSDRKIPMTNDCIPYLESLTKEYVERINHSEVLKHYGWENNDVAKSLADKIYPEEFSEHVKNLVESWEIKACTEDFLYSKHLSEKFIIGEMDDNKADYLGNEMQEYFKETSFRSGIGNAVYDEWYKEFFEEKVKPVLTGKPFEFKEDFDIDKEVEKVIEDMSDEEVREILDIPDEEIEAIQKLLDATKLDDVKVYRNDGNLTATDEDGNTWTNKDLYQFLLNEVVQLDENNQLVEGYDVEQGIIDDVVKYSKNYDAQIFPAVSNYEQAVKDSVDKEFDDFKKELLKKTPEEIFLANYKIHVFTELNDTLQCEGILDEEYYKALYQENGSILAGLYDDFVSHEYASVNTGEDTLDFIREYCEDYHSDILDEKQEVDIPEENNDTPSEVTDDKAIEYPDINDIAKVKAFVKEGIAKEYEKFEKEERTKTPEELIHTDNYRIRFYNELASFFEDYGDTLDDKNFIVLMQDVPNVLANLYDYYLDSEYVSINNYNDTADLIKYYNGRYHPEMFLPMTNREKFIDKLNGEMSKVERNKVTDKEWTFYRCIQSAVSNDDIVFFDNFFASMNEMEKPILSSIYDFYMKTNGDEGFTEYSVGDTILKFCLAEMPEKVCPYFYGKDTENTGYYYFAKGLSVDSLAECQNKADDYVIAAPTCHLSKDEMEKFHVFFLKIGRDIDEKELFNYDTAINKMQTAVYQVVKAREEEARNVLKAHVACKESIEYQISQNFDGSHLNTNFVKGVVDEFGLQCVTEVLANTIKQKESDGRFSFSNKEWARGIELDDGDAFQIRYIVESHPAVLDGFIDEVRKIEKQNMEENKMAENEAKTKWVTMNVSHRALIEKYEKHSFFRMPETSKYKGYTYNIFNDRIKESRQLADLESDGHELCYQFILPEDFEITLKNTRTDDELTVTASEFKTLMGENIDKDYDREEKNFLKVSVPPEATRGTFESSSLFVMPNNSKYKGYSYYIPNSMVEEDKESEEGRIVISIPEDFTVTVKNRETGEEEKLTASEFREICNRTSGVDYDNNRNTEKKDDTSANKDWHYVKVPKEARIAEYENRSLFKMPEGEYSGYCFYVPKGCVNDNKDGETLRLSFPDNMSITLINKQSEESETVQLENVELIELIQGKTKEDYEQQYKPSKEMNTKFLKVEDNLREYAPKEMLDRPNWVGVRTKLKEDGRLEKYLIDCHTGKHAESDNPETWTDFESACEYARNNGCVALAYALDGKDKVCCIDVDHCRNEQGEYTSLVDSIKEKSGGTYMERSVSGNGVHFFGKTDGMDIRAFSKDGDLEFYQKTHFITMTGDTETKAELKNFDNLKVSELLRSKCEKRVECSGQGRGVEGLSKMSDRDVVDKAIKSKHGDTFKALYEGQDIRNNHSNSDMALMNRLAFWCNGDKEQMLRIFESSGLYRPEKSQDYYECTVIKAIRDTANRFQPQEYQPKAPVSNSNNYGKR